MEQGITGQCLAGHPTPAVSCQPRQFLIDFSFRPKHSLILFKVVGMQLLACWDCGFESRREYGCLSLVIVVCCQVQISATS